MRKQSQCALQEALDHFLWRFCWYKVHTGCAAPQWRCLVQEPLQLMLQKKRTRDNNAQHY